MGVRPCIAWGAAALAAVLLAQPSYGSTRAEQAFGTLGFRAEPLMLSSELAHWAARLPRDENLPEPLLFDPRALGDLPDAVTRIHCDGAGPGLFALTEGRSAVEPENPRRGRLLESGLAAWNELRGRTASGAIADPRSMTAGHRSLPFGSRVRVVNSRTGKSVVVRIDDRAPRRKKFAIDLSKGAAQALGIAGVSPVSIYLLTDERPGRRAHARSCGR